MTRAYSVRLILLAALLSGMEMALPYFPLEISHGTFALLSFSISAAALVVRFIAQKDLLNEDLTKPLEESEKETKNVRNSGWFSGRRNRYWFGNANDPGARRTPDQRILRSGGHPYNLLWGNFGRKSWRPGDRQ